MATKRKDSNRIVLKKGEYQRTNGTYAFRWTDENGKRHEVYAKDLDDLRAKESEIEIDTTEGLKAEARYTIINEMLVSRFVDKLINIKSYTLKGILPIMMAMLAIELLRVGLVRLLEKTCPSEEESDGEKESSPEE